MIYFAFSTSLSIIFKLVFGIMGFAVCLIGILLADIFFKITPPLDKERNIRVEKDILMMIVLFSFVLLLFALTILIYIVVNYFSDFDTNLEFYNYVIAAAASGAMWGVGTEKIYRFWSWVEYGKNYDKNFDLTKKGKDSDWYSPESFIKNLHLWKRKCIIAILFFVIVGVLILNKINSLP